MKAYKLTLIAGIIATLVIIAGVAFFGINSMMQNNEDLIYKKAPLHERIAARSEQNHLMTRDPNTGKVPTERLLEAKKYKDRLMSSESYLKGAISGVQWVDIGPDTVGGRTRAIMFDPTDATNKRVIAAGVTGGMWKNADITNPATVWTKVNDFMDNLSVVSIAYDPNATSTWYAATGEIESHSVSGAGLFKSTDAGVTWSQLSSTLGGAFGSANPDMIFASDVVCRNEGGTTAIYVGCGTLNLGDLADPAGGNAAFQGNNGLWRSTDGGSTWAQVLESGNSGFHQRISDIKIDGSNNLVVATGRNAAGDLGGDIYRCTGTNCNTNASFAKILDENTDRTIFDVAPSNSNIVYAASKKVAGGNQDVAYLKKTVDGGANWTDLTIPPISDVNNNCAADPSGHFTRQQAFYDLTIRVNPTDPNVVLMGGIDMWRSTDGGANFNLASIWIRNICNLPYMHSDHHEIVYRPGTNEVVFGNDGGVAYSSNAGDASVTGNLHFRDHIVGYNTSQFYSADIHPTSGQNDYIGGLQDNGSNEWDAANGNLTVEVTGGDGASSHIDQDNGDVQITAYTYNVYYRTLDEWVTPNNNTTFHNDGNNGRFINPTDYDDTGNILYGANAANVITRCTGIASASPTCTDETVGGSALGGGQASALKVDPNTNTTLYVGSSGNGVPTLSKITNANTGTMTSTSIGNASWPANTYLSAIDVEVGNSNHMIVTLSNYGTANVWETTDGGANWTNVEGNLPDMPVRWVTFSPHNADHALLGTELGVWSTDDLNGASTVWGATNSGLANVRVDMIKYRASDKKFVAGTHGRGLFVGEVVSGMPTLTLAVAPSMVVENSGSPFTYTFTRTGPTTAALVANFGINASSTASAADYTVSTGGTGAVTFSGTTGTVTFPIGASTVTVTVTPTGDTSVETNETVVMDITADAANYILGTPATATGTINDDDTATLPTLTLAVSPTMVNEDAGSPFTYTFSRTGATTAALVTNFSINASSTASAADYTVSTGGTGAVTFSGTTGTVTFPIGASTVTVIVTPTSDTSVESNETVIMDITADAANYTLGTPTTATGTITDDDSTPCPPDYAGANALSGNQSTMMDFETDGIIESTQVIDGGAGQNVDYDSGNSIELNGPFEVKNNTVFHAFIDGCGGAAAKEETTEYGSKK